MTNKQFQKIIAEYERLVFTVCYRMVGDYEEAQNLTQETFISAFVHIDSCQTDNYKAWIIRIASNKAKDYLKSAYNRKVRQMEDDFDAPSEKIPIEERYIQKESADIVKKEILALNEPYHKVSVMYFLEEQTVSEIAERLKRPKKTVQTQISRAKDILKRNLKKEELI